MTTDETLEAAERIAWADYTRATEEMETASAADKNAACVRQHYAQKAWFRTADAIWSAARKRATDA